MRTVFAKLGITVIAPAQVPAGLLVALLGTPYLVWLLWRSQRSRALTPVSARCGSAQISALRLRADGRLRA